MNSSNLEGLFIILPTLNEYENLNILYPKIRNLFPLATVVVVDDDSTDQTRDYLSRLKKVDSRIITVLRHTRLGIGSRI